MRRPLRPLYAQCEAHLSMNHFRSTQRVRMRPGGSLARYLYLFSYGQAETVQYALLICLPVEKLPHLVLPVQLLF